MEAYREKVDVCVVGAGHAGCEAALACARLGLETVMFTVSVDSIAMMPCNPNIGGTSKGHLVRELDALGGEMGKNIDRTFIQSRMLNGSKGPAVHSLRAQADKEEYSRAMRRVLENQEHLCIKQAEVCEILWEEVLEEGEGSGENTFGIDGDLGEKNSANGVYLERKINENSENSEQVFTENNRDLTVNSGEKNAENSIDFERKNICCSSDSAKKNAGIMEKDQLKGAVKCKEILQRISAESDINLEKTPDNCAGNLEKTPDKSAENLENRHDKSVENLEKKPGNSAENSEKNLVDSDIKILKKFIKNDTDMEKQPAKNDEKLQEKSAEIDRNQQEKNRENSVCYTEKNARYTGDFAENFPGKGSINQEKSAKKSEENSDKEADGEDNYFKDLNDKTAEKDKILLDKNSGNYENLKNRIICCERNSQESQEKSSCHRVRKRVRGVRIFTGMVYECRAVILCTGTYLGARCLCGDAVSYTGPGGLQAANLLTESLKGMGIALRRFKTGTPARMDGRSIDFSKMEEQPGDKRVVPFSFSTDPENVQKEQVSCWLTYTNEKTHEIIRRNLDRSPLYGGMIEGTGPRYCPSIEDKVVKFADKERHQVFIEPEGLHTNEMYVAGMSSSLPEDVQLAMYRTVPGLEHCRIVRNAYAIEYDCLDSGQLDRTLEFKDIEGLFSGGQFNGSSGDEEAACQGLVAGINAAMCLLKREPLLIDRSEGYIGVLIDDLVTKDNREPYRMMTSRAEYRLLLRQDNADLRLREKGYQAGLVSQEEYNRFLEKADMIKKEISRLKGTMVGAGRAVQEFLQAHGSSTLKTAASLAEILCRPEISYELLGDIDGERKPLPQDVTEQVQIEIKYEGYIVRQMAQVQQYRKMEKKMIPQNIDYDGIASLRLEARQKLKQFRPSTVGQASRISGVSPADVSVLLVYLGRGCT